MSRFFLVRSLVRCATVVVAFLLVAFNLRRVLLALAVIFPGKQCGLRNVRSPDQVSLPDVLVLVACRDEEAVIRGLCDALDRLDYPANQLQVVLIDDGSKDGTYAAIEAFAACRSSWAAFRLAQNFGKANALNVALSHNRFGDVVFVFDADHRPEPAVLQRAAPYFADKQVAGLSGRTVPSNALASPIAYYCTVEGHLHQMVTMRGKDRLGLAPALLGSNCGYRRTALAACGGFRGGALLEDSDLTLTFYRAGYQVRFAEDVIAYHQVPENLDGYLNQHARWARGFNDVALVQGRDLVRERTIPIVLRLELLMFALGYLDRLALACAGALSVVSRIDRRLARFPRPVLYLAVLAPMAQVITLFVEQRVSSAMWVRTPWIPLLFVLDVLAAGRAMVGSLSRSRRMWIKTQRRPTP